MFIVCVDIHFIAASRISLHWRASPTSGQCSSSTMRYSFSIDREHYINVPFVRQHSVMGLAWAGAWRRERGWDTKSISRMTSMVCEWGLQQCCFHNRNRLKVSHSVPEVYIPRQTFCNPLHSSILAYVHACTYSSRPRATQMCCNWTHTIALGVWIWDY